MPKTRHPSSEPPPGGRPTPSHDADDTATPSEHRRRLLDAMADTVASKGYAATTIADLAGAARVSKRSFYEHFDHKAACLVALYEVASAQALGVLQASVDPTRDWHAQVEQALQAYFGVLARSPALLQTLFVEILALGPIGLAARRRVHRQLADFIGSTVAHGDDAAPPRLPATLATGIVGAIHELLLQAIEEGHAERLTELVAPASAIVRSVIDGCTAAGTRRRA